MQNKQLSKIFLRSNNLQVKSQTFFNLFIFEGGHRPVFLILRLRTSFFLRSRIFLEIFVLILCSNFSCSFESNGSFSSGKYSSSSLSDWGSSLSTTSASEDTLTINSPLFLLISQKLLQDFRWWWPMDFICNLGTETKQSPDEITAFEIKVKKGKLWK